MHTKYTSEAAGKSYDAIVIGSGLGGLTTAALLARQGKKVLVLEKHYEPGGFTHTFKRKHFLFDVGLHYVGQVMDETTPLRKAFDYVTEGRLKWGSMDDVYDRAIIGNKHYEFVAGKENQEQQFIRYFPQEEQAIKAYFRLISSMGAATPLFFGEKTMPRLLSKWIGFLLRRKFNKVSSQLTYDALKKLTDNEELISLLCAQCGNYGLTPQKSSLAIHAIVADHYTKGGAYPVGGAAEIYRAIYPAIKNNGGDVLIRAGVKHILVEKGKAIGVKMENGDELFAKKIISNAGARNTFTRLIRETSPRLDAIRNDLQHIKPSSAHICLYVGLKASGKTLNLPNCNYWVYKSHRFEQDHTEYMATPGNTPPLYYISFPSTRDATWDDQFPGTATAQVIVAASYEWVKQWEDARWMKRGDEYERLKKQFEQTLLDKLYEVVPQVKEHVALAEISTPISTNHFTSYGTGEIYGLEHTPFRFGLNWLRPQTPIKNLYLTGQDTLTVGIGGALFSGVITASAILSKNFFGIVTKGHKSEIRKEKNNDEH